MGDIEEQTAVRSVGEGRYTADVHQDWEIWGPCGGYVAAIALRAAGRGERAGPAGQFLRVMRTRPAQLATVFGLLLMNS
jgi:hypothetical protein